ncbi:hypothetical protein FACS1894176_01200 [Bacteroidia bacterium]|nr:hypothetical protein FACS1894176_01200 [Bacteroidia bacterium]
MDAITLLKENYGKSSDEEIRKVLERAVIFYDRVEGTSQIFYKHSDAFIERIMANPRGIGIDYRENADIKIPDPRLDNREALLVLVKVISSASLMDFGEVVDQMTEKQKLNTKSIWIDEDTIRIGSFENYPAFLRRIWLFGD